MREHIERPAAWRERGSASVVVAGACALLVMVALGGGAVTATAYSAAQAKSAADLSALAGAAADLSRVTGGGAGATDPCSVAAGVAGRNGATLTSCSVHHGLSLTVTVEVSLPAMVTTLSGAAVVAASARAGPVLAPP